MEVIDKDTNGKWKNTNPLRARTFKVPLCGESSELNNFLAEHEIEEIKPGTVTCEALQGQQLVVLVLYRNK